MVEQSEGLAALEEVFLRGASLHYAMKDRDRERLLTSYGDVFAQLRQDHGMTHFYFHGPDRVNLLRVHKPEKHGDLIDRFTAREAERTGKMAFGIELGPLGTFTLRVVRPVFDGGTLIGYIELGKEIEDILAGIHDKHGVELALDIRKSVLDRTKWEAGMKMLGREADWNRFPDDVLIYTSMPRFPSECEQYVGEAGLTHDDVTTEAEFNGKSWRVMANPLKDASGAEVGDLIVMDDISEAKSAFNRLVAVAVGVALLLVTALIGFLYVVLRHTDQGIYKQQEALRESETRYRTLAQYSRTGIYIHIGGLMKFVNNSFAEMLGYTPEEIVGRQYWEFVHPGDREMVKKISLGRARGEAAPAEYEFRHLSKDGKTVWVHNLPIIIQYQGQTANMGNLAYINDRKQAEEALRESEEKYRTILESMEEGYYEVDLAGNFIFFNDAMCKIRGYSREELMGMSNREYMTEETAKEVFKAFSNVYTTGKPTKNLEWETIRKDGTKGYVETSASLVKNSAGKPIGFRGVVRDISEKQRLESQLQQAQKMKSIGTLAGGIAHNFNNLLMGIQGNASIMFLDIDSSHPRHKNLKSIEKLVENGAKLTAQLIGYAREGKYEVKPISLNQLVKETSDTFGMTKKDITVHQSFLRSCMA